MSVAKITETYLDDIADAIRFKLSTEQTYTPPQMASAIMSITGGPNAVAVVDTIDPDTGGTIRRIIGTDISDDTVTSGTLLAGYTAHAADGTLITGTANGGRIYQDEDGYLVFSESGGVYTGGEWVEQTISDDGAVEQALNPHTLYHFTGALTSLTITLNAPNSGEVAHYHFDFLSGSTAPTLSMPNTVTMPDSFAVEASKRYEIDVLNNFGTVVKWAS